MSRIYFDPNGASMDHSFEVDEFKQVLNILDTHKNDIDINIYNKIKEIFDKAKEQKDRSIHIVVSEPVEYEYEYDDY